MSGWRDWVNHALSGLFCPACAACASHCRARSMVRCARCAGAAWPASRRRSALVRRSRSRRGVSRPRCGPLRAVPASCAGAWRARPPSVRTKALSASVVHALKYDRRLSTVAPLAAMMRAAGADVLRGAHAVVPVPLHARRAWSRGFNQSSLLARHLGLPSYSLLVGPGHAAAGERARGRARTGTCEMRSPPATRAWDASSGARRCRWPAWWSCSSTTCARPARRWRPADARCARRGSAKCGRLQRPEC